MTRRLVLWGAFMALVAWACNLPLTPLPPTPTPAALLDPLGQQPSPTYPLVLETPTPPPPTAALASPTPTRTPWTLLPTVTPAPGQDPNCDLAAPGHPSIDVTVPDDTPMQPGQEFVKVWRLRNAGTCTWTPDYAVVWVSGDRLGAPAVVYLQTSVPPGASIDVSVPMRAPEEPGTYQGNWMLRNAQGRLFGLVPSGLAHFWVRIVVVAPTDTPTPPPSPTPTGVIVIPSPTATKLPETTPTPTPTPPPPPTATPTPTPTP